MSSTPSSSRPPSRQSSLNSRYINQPSRLRQSQSATPERSSEQHEGQHASSTHEPLPPRSSEASNATTLANKSPTTARDRIVESYFRLSGKSGCNNCASGDCEHGTLSPRPRAALESWNHSVAGGKDDTFGGKFDSRGGDIVHNLLGDAVADGLIGETAGRGDPDDDSGIKRMSTTEWLARRHGIKRRRTMYVHSISGQARPLASVQASANHGRRVSREADTDCLAGISHTTFRSCNGYSNTSGHTFKET